MTRRCFLNFILACGTAAFALLDRPRRSPVPEPAPDPLMDGYLRLSQCGQDQQSAVLRELLTAKPSHYCRIAP